MKPKRILTLEQITARDERRAKFQTLFQRVAKMTDAERMEIVNRSGAVLTAEGRALSVKNTCLLFFQLPTVSIVGGFRQWLKAGRCVMKGQHGAQIFIPLGCGTSEQAVETAEAAADAGAGVRFGTATVFDITQTVELDAETAVETSPASCPPSLQHSHSFAAA